jgi:hypothetical protein
MDGAERLELDGVADSDVLQATEETVAMSGDAAVPRRAGTRGAFDMSDGAVQRPIVGTAEYGHFECDSGDAKHRQ